MHKTTYFATWKNGRSFSSRYSSTRLEKLVKLKFLQFLPALDGSVNIHNMLDKQVATMFRLHRIAQSNYSIDLLLACTLANAT